MKWFGKYRNVGWSLGFLCVSLSCLVMFPQTLDRGLIFPAALILLSGIASMCVATFIFHYSNTKSGH